MGQVVSSPASKAALLFERVKGGDEEAFKQLYDSHHARVLSAVKKFINEPDTANFVTNGVFIKVWQVRNSPSGFKGTSTFATWLTRIAYNAALMYLRRGAGERRHVEYTLDAPTVLNTTAGLSYLKRSQSGEIKGAREFPFRDMNLEGTIDRLEEEGNRKKLTDAIAQLPDTYRTVVRLRLLEGRSIRETSEAMGIEATAVKSRLFRSRQILKEVCRRPQIAKSRLTAV